VDVTRDQRWVGRRSVYVIYGDWFVVVCTGLFAAGAMLVRMSGPTAAAGVK
jgi:hypothetical protein